MVNRYRWHAVSRSLPRCLSSGYINVCSKSQIGRYHFWEVSNGQPPFAHCLFSRVQRKHWYWFGLSALALNCFTYLFMIEHAFLCIIIIMLFSRFLSDCLPLSYLPLFLFICLCIFLATFSLSFLRFIYNLGVTRICVIITWAVSHNL